MREYLELRAASRRSRITYRALGTKPDGVLYGQESYTLHLMRVSLIIVICNATP